MNFSTKTRAAAIAAAALAMSLASGVAKADAIAQSILNVTNFTILAGNGAAGGGGSLLGLTDIQATTTSDTFASLAGFGTQNGPALSCRGACGAYNPGVAIPAPTGPSATYSGSSSTQTGNALIGGANALTDNTVSLHPDGDGTAQGNVNLNALFSVGVNTANTKLQLAFDSNAFLRSYLSEVSPGATATSAFSWTVTLTDDDNNEVFSWTPDGFMASGGAIAGGTEYADSFKLVDSTSKLSTGNTEKTRSGHFEVETNGLEVGTYTLSIRHSSQADAFLRVPEPASLALVGLALVGMGSISRRRKIS